MCLSRLSKLFILLFGKETGRFCSSDWQNTRVIIEKTHSKEEFSMDDFDDLFGFDSAFEDDLEDDARLMMDDDDFEEE